VADFIDCNIFLPMGGIRMKKVFKIIVLVVLSFLLLGMPVVAFAEEVEPPVVEEEKEPTIDDFKAEVQAWLEQYMEESMVVKIINWLADIGVLSALFVVYLKYRKYKHTTIEDLTKQFGDKVGVWLKENFDKLSEEQISQIKDSVAKLEESNETMMKVLVLMQDNTAKGKAALIEFLGSKTESQEVKEAVKDVNEKLEEQEKITKEIKDKVSGDYEEIF